MILPAGNFCVGLGVQLSKKTARKFKSNKLLSLRWCLWWIFIGIVCTWQGMKAEPNYFSSLALNIFKVPHSTDIIVFFFPCIISTARWIFKHYFLLVSLFHNKRWDFQHYCSITFGRVLSTSVFSHYTYIHVRNSSIRNLYSTLYLITIEIQHLITIERQQAEQKKN